MSFIITPITEADVSTFVQLDEDAYEGNPLRESISSWHTASPEIRTQHLEWSAKMLRQWLPDQGTVFRKAALPDNGQIIGWAAWNKPKSSTEEERLDDRKVESDDNDGHFDLSPCLNPEAAKEHMALWRDMMEKHTSHRGPYWCLAKLAVDQRHPDAADALVKHMLVSVDESELAAFTGSTPDTVKMYEANGFCIVETVPRLNESYSFSFMLRTARKA